jgi:hypothetical protein
MIEKIAYRYLIKLTKLPTRAVDALHLLSDEEVSTIRREVIYTLFWAAVFGTIGVLALYLPQIYFSEYFYEYRWAPSFLTDPITIPVVNIIYGFILVYIEIYALMAINIRAVYKIAEVCGFPDKNDPDFDKHIESLMRVGLEKDDKSDYTYGINPMQGASKWALFLFLLINRLKATISNYVIKMIVRRMMGRYALRTMANLINIGVGIPVFAFWNAYASYIVIHETKVRIMAPTLIRQLCRNLHERYKDTPEFTGYIYDTLQYIAMSKRKYHHNHFLLAKNILLAFNIPVKDVHPLSEDYFETIKNAKPEIKEGVIQLLVVGFIIDGNLSPQENGIIARLHKEGIIPFDIKRIKVWIRSFVKGKGLDGLVDMK